MRRELVGFCFPDHPCLPAQPPSQYRKIKSLKNSRFVFDNLKETCHRLKQEAKRRRGRQPRREDGVPLPPATPCSAFRSPAGKWVTFSVTGSHPQCQAGEKPHRVWAAEGPRERRNSHSVRHQQVEGPALCPRSHFCSVTSRGTELSLQSLHQGTCGHRDTRTAAGYRHIGTIL